MSDKWSSSPSPNLLLHVTLWLALAMLLYSAVAEVRYRWIHPELTETELMFRSVDILLWR